MKKGLSTAHCAFVSPHLMRATLHLQNLQHFYTLALPDIGMEMYGNVKAAGTGVGLEGGKYLCL